MRPRGVLSVIRSALLIGPKSAGARATPQGDEAFHAAQTQKSAGRPE